MLLHVKVLRNVVRVILLSLLSMAVLTTVAFWVASYHMPWPSPSGFERRLGDDVAVQRWGGWYRAVVRSGPFDCSGVSLATYAGRLWVRASRRVPFPGGAKERYINFLGLEYARGLREPGTLNLHWGEIWAPWPLGVEQRRWILSTRALETDLVVPFWMLTAVLAAGPLAALVNRRRRRQSLPARRWCPGCGYELTLPVGNRCPECGESYGLPWATENPG